MTHPLKKKVKVVFRCPLELDGSHIEQIFYVEDVLYPSPLVEAYESLLFLLLFFNATSVTCRVSTFKETVDVSVLAYKQKYSIFFDYLFRQKKIVLEHTARDCCLSRKEFN